MMAEGRVAAAVRTVLSEAGAIREVKMFGGIGFLLNGNMVSAVSKRGLLLRVGKDRYSAALTRPGVRPMEMRGRMIEGYVYVDPSVMTKAAIETWLRDALAFVQTLPPKEADPKPIKKGKRR
jgi:TfoX/Sxy family transcriptional regulator of competence genes